MGGVDEDEDEEDDEDEDDEDDINLLDMLVFFRKDNDFCVIIY
jgi:hypothetical protein